MLLQKVKNGRFTIPSDLPADARDLIARMLVVHPERRITVSPPLVCRSACLGVMADM